MRAPNKAQTIAIVRFLSFSCSDDDIVCLPNKWWGWDSSTTPTTHSTEQNPSNTVNGSLNNIDNSTTVNAGPRKNNTREWMLIQGLFFIQWLTYLLPRSMKDAPNCKRTRSSQEIQSMPGARAIIECLVYHPKDWCVVQCNWSAKGYIGQ